jgi:hypothetical protein
MRLVSVLCVTVLALGICSAVAFADKPVKTEEAEWHWDLTGSRATYAEVEPNDACATAQTMACGDIINPARIDIAGDNDWYAFQGTAGIPITIGTDASDLCDPDAGDTYIYLMSSDCTTQLAADDDSGPGLYSLISNYNPTYTGTYYARVRHYSSSSTGCYKFFVNCAPPATGACCLAGGACQVLTQAECGTAGGTYQGDNTVCQPNPCPQPPVNDTCAGAIVMERCGSGQFTGSLAAGVNDYSPTNSCTGYAANGKDVVYAASLVAGDILHLVYTTPAYDGSLYVLTDCADMASCVIGEDDPEPETIDWTATSTGTFYIIADAYTTNGGSDFTLDWSITCPPPTGACCFPDGSCQVLAEVDCVGLGGIWYGPTVGCDPNPCPPPVFACCFPGGQCVMLPEADCLAQGGAPLFGVDCEPVNPCEQPPMACCYTDGHCEFVTEVLCVELGGVPQGYGTNCEPNLCPQPAMACCFTDGHCEYVTEDSCLALGGTPQGFGTDCEPNDCPQPPATGACCLDDQGHCQVLTQEECVGQGGAYQGDDTGCDPNPCPIVPTQNSTWGQIKANYR